jgi:hypothetical protein
MMCYLNIAATEGTTMATHHDLSDSQIAMLAELSTQCEPSLDDLPYTDDFELLYTRFVDLVGV